MTIGAILTMGLGQFGSVNLLPTLGYSSKVAALLHHGADDYVDDYQEQRVKRLARIKVEDEMVLKIIVKMVTEGMLQ